MDDLCSEMKVLGISNEKKKRGDFDVEEEVEEKEFSFMCGGGDTPTITAEDAFIDGKLKPMFPITASFENLPIRAPVKKVFVEIEEASTSSDRGNVDDPAGPYCELSSRKAVEVPMSIDTCKKSNSTGFSKMRRIKNLMERSNSDGRDTFVFLSKKPPSAAAVKTETTKRGKSRRKSTKTASFSAHETYLRIKAKEEEQRRTYLPYRVGLMGFFTNFNGGLSKNIHPF